MPEPANLHLPTHPVRVVTAASLFDGHDAAINVIRRILQAQGAEVVHLGHDRSVAEVVEAVVQEDAAAVAISSYQGGHLEYFGYLVELLAQRGMDHVRVFGGGGGVIVAEEIAALAAIGVRIYSPADGQRLGLPGMINEIIVAADVDPASAEQPETDAVRARDDRAVARAITLIENGRLAPHVMSDLAEMASRRHAPVLGITGTGGSGKSSLTDELIRRLRQDSRDGVSVAVLAVDPTRRRGGGALLGDRIRMNALQPGVTFFRSLATRGASQEIPAYLAEVITVCQVGFDLVIVETPGIGQGDGAIGGLADVSVYVMTPEFGAASQLEKIEMLDLADAVAVNKVERASAAGGEDACRDVARQMVRNREAFGVDWRQMPVFGTSAARFGDDGVTALYQYVRAALQDRGLRGFDSALGRVEVSSSSGLRAVLPPERSRYLAEIARTVREYHRRTDGLAGAARRRQHLATAVSALAAVGASSATLTDLAAQADAELGEEFGNKLAEWPEIVREYQADELVYQVRGEHLRVPLRSATPAGTLVPRIALPRTDDHAELVRFLRQENLPGKYPFTAGAFPLKRQGEAPTRMFAGEGDPFRTNRRFHLLAADQPATRLSTAFDSVTLYGRDPELRPDVYGKVGTSGVSVATVDDLRELYRGFDLCSPTTSVSMTINGPAPTVLAMFFVAAIQAQGDDFVNQHGREPTEQEWNALRAKVLQNVRGTVQADILKEDQGQNTCIFSTEFALRCMADVQEFFIANKVRNFYSVSVSGYHIAEAGANPITQLAFTLANGFTYVEAYLARGMLIDDFAPNFSFFFSNGMDAEYTVIGRVARRIWAIAMKERYGASERSQKLKYHVQTSGRSLHAQEMDFNDIRTTLQALCAIYDNANSLHTNAYDEAVTTPTAHSVRRALAIQMIIDAEWGLAACENPLQGSAIVTELTDLVEAAVLAEFDRIAARNGVLGAMETGYQRGRIQDESMLYEQRKHDGSLPLIGVNTFVNRDHEESKADHSGIELARGTDAEKQLQLARLEAFHRRHAAAAPLALARLQQVAATGGNVFAELMETVRVCSLGQITKALFEVGGQYRRSV